MELSMISFFLLKMSLESSLSFCNELRNLALASYSILSDSYSARRLVLKSAKSLADLISCSSSPLMASLRLSMRDWTTETMLLTTISAASLFPPFSSIEMRGVWLTYLSEGLLFPSELDEVGDGLLLEKVGVLAEFFGVFTTFAFFDEGALLIGDVLLDPIQDRQGVLVFSQGVDEQRVGLASLFRQVFQLVLVRVVSLVVPLQVVLRLLYLQAANVNNPPHYSIESRSA